MLIGTMECRQRLAKMTEVEGVRGLLIYHTRKGQHWAVSPGFLLPPSGKTDTRIGNVYKLVGSILLVTDFTSATCARTPLDTVRFTSMCEDNSVVFTYHHLFARNN